MRCGVSKKERVESPRRLHFFAITREVSKRVLETAVKTGCEALPALLLIKLIRRYGCGFALAFFGRSGFACGAFAFALCGFGLADGFAIRQH